MNEKIASFDEMESKVDWLAKKINEFQEALEQLTGEVAQLKVNPAVALRAKRPIETRACLRCGNTFEASDRRAKYCSNACQQAVKNERYREKKMKKAQ